MARRYLFHSPGITYAVTTVVLVLGAINGQNNLLFIIFGLAVGGLIVSGVLSGANLMGIRIDRETPGHAHAGEHVTLRYAVRNINRFLPAFGLLIEELPLHQPHTQPPAQPSAQPSTTKLTLLGRVKSFLRLAPRANRGHAGAGARTHLGPAAACALHVPSGTVFTCNSSPKALVRGVANCSRFRVTSTFPFGLTRKSVIFECRQQVLIFPARRVVTPHTPPWRSGEHATKAQTLASRLGDEFFSLREYRPGDPQRNIAWRASARSGTLRVREFVRARSCYILIECHLGSTPAQTEEALARACSLAEYYIHQDHNSTSGASHQIHIALAILTPLQSSFPTQQHKSSPQPAPQAPSPPDGPLRRSLLTPFGTGHRQLLAILEAAARWTPATPPPPTSSPLTAHPTPSQPTPSLPAPLPPALTDAITIPIRGDTSDLHFRPPQALPHPSGKLNLIAPAQAQPRQTARVT